MLVTLASQASCSPSGRCSPFRLPRSGRRWRSAAEGWTGHSGDGFWPQLFPPTGSDPVTRLCGEIWKTKYLFKTFIQISGTSPTYTHWTINAFYSRHLIVNKFHNMIIHHVSDCKRDFVRKKFLCRYTDSNPSPSYSCLLARIAKHLKKPSSWTEMPRLPYSERLHLRSSTSPRKNQPDTFTGDFQLSRTKPIHRAIVNNILQFRPKLTNVDEAMA